MLAQRRLSLDSATHLDSSGHFNPRYPFHTRGLFDRRNAVTNLDIQESEIGFGFTSKANVDRLEELPYKKSKISQSNLKGSMTDKPRRRKSVLDKSVKENNADAEMEADGVHDKIKERIELIKDWVF